jgi:hypothetical protein
MAFGTLAANQWVSYNNLQDAATTLLLPATGTGIPATNRWIPKSAASTYVNIDTSVATYAAKSSTQWLAKRDLQPYAPYSFSIWYVQYLDGVSGYNVKADACAHATGATQTVYCNTATIAAGSLLYYYSPGLSRYYPWLLDYIIPNLWLYNITNSFPFSMVSRSSNAVSTVDTCAAPTSTIFINARGNSAGTYYLFWTSDGTNWNLVPSTSIGNSNGSTYTVVVPASSGISWCVTNGNTTNYPAANGYFAMTGASGTSTCPAAGSSCVTYNVTSAATGGTLTIAVTGNSSLGVC